MQKGGAPGGVLGNTLDHHLLRSFLFNVLAVPAWAIVFTAILPVARNAAVATARGPIAAVAVGAARSTAARLLFFAGCFPFFHVTLCVRVVAFPQNEHVAPWVRSDRACTSGFGATSWVTDLSTLCPLAPGFSPFLFMFHPSGKSPCEIPWRGRHPRRWSSETSHRCASQKLLSSLPGCPSPRTLRWCWRCRG